MLVLKQFQMRLPKKSMTVKVILGTKLTKRKRHLKFLQQFKKRLPIRRVLLQ